MLPDLYIIVHAVKGHVPLYGGCQEPNVSYERVATPNSRLIFQIILFKKKKVKKKKFNRKSREITIINK